MWALLPFLASYITAICALVGLALGGPWFWLTPVVVFVGVPILDAVGGLDTEDTLPEGAASSAHDVLVRMWVGTQLVVLTAALSVVSTHSLGALEFSGLLFSVGLVSGGGAINAAHELMHRANRFDRACAEFLMMSTNYTWFCIEHVHGHHRHVATPKDPATATLGQSIYGFLPQTVLGGFRSAWHIERQRCLQRKIGAFSWQNRMTRYAVLGAFSWVVVLAVFGPMGLAFHVAQGAVAVGLLEVINYVEHYGLRRLEVAPDRYERVAPRHSWNANHRVSNWWLFNLQRHADHHARASRPYYRLRAVEEGPQLPFGYPTAILTALVPPLWFALMNPRVARAQVEVAREGVVADS